MQIIEVSGARKGKRKTAAPKTDMTPMVDLGFLLITFFVLTAQMAAPRTMNLNMPKDAATTPMPVEQSDALTVVFNGDKTMYYKGEFLEAQRTNALIPVSLNVREGLGKVIRDFRAERKAAGSDMILIVKPGPESNYGTVVKVLDETLINNVERHVMVPAVAEELESMK